MYQIEEEKDGSSRSVKVSDYPSFREWREAVKVAEGLVMFRRQSVKSVWRSKVVRVVSDDGEVVWEEQV